MTRDVQYIVKELYRQHYSKMVASLISYFGLTNLEVAEDIVQDTFISALEKWNEKIPDDCPAWLYKVCKNKTLNILQKKRTEENYSANHVREEKFVYQIDQLFLDHEIKDNQLRLLFACCYGSLSRKAQIILILKNLCGLKVEEIARALAMNEEAVTKTLTRSKNTLAKDNVTLGVPFITRSREKLNSVHTAIYLLFNEGYSATTGDDLIKQELCMEAMRLMKSILDIPEISTPDSYALMALMCFHSSRFKARMNMQDEIVELENQDRSLWDKDLITLGNYYFKKSNYQGQSTRFILEAAIASVHCATTCFTDTNWKLIIELYTQLAKVHPSPFADLNLAVCIYYGMGKAEALELLNTSTHLIWLKNYYLYYAFRAKIAEAESDYVNSIEHYKKALSLTRQKAEQEFIRRKIKSIEEIG